MNVLLISTGFNASAHVKPRSRRILTVCHFKPRRAAHWAAGSVTPSRVIGVAPAQIVLLMGMRGMEVEKLSQVAARMALSRNIQMREALCD